MEIKHDIFLQGSLDEQLEILLSKAFVIKEYLDNHALLISQTIGGEYVSAPIKTKERAIEKIMAEKDNEVSSLEDIVRCSMLFDSYEKMLEAERLLSKKFDVLHVQNLMKNPIEAFDGYRRIMILAKVDGFLVEIQVMLDVIYDLKIKSRELYLEKRKIIANKEIEKRDFTKEEKQKLLDLKIESIKIYDDVLELYNLKTKGQKLKLHSECF